MIKNKIAALMVGLCALSAGASVAQAQESKPLIVAVDTAFVPFEFKQGNEYVGFDVDLWAALARHINVQYTLQPMDFTGLIPGLQTRNIDVALAGIGIRDDRKKVIDFSDPYYESGLSILVAQNDSTITQASDLAGKLVGLKTGTVAVDFMKQEVPKAELRLFPNIDNAYLELATGRVDAAVHDTPNVRYYAQTAGKGRVKVAASVKSGDFYGIAFPKGSALVPKVNEALKTIKANGEYQAIYTKWFGQTQ